MEENLVHLTTAGTPFQIFAIEEALKSGAIPYTILDRTPASAIIGTAGPLDNQEFMVPKDRLQEAKDVLCGNGIVCEVSERLLKRALDEIVRPLLEGGSVRDLSRLVRFIEVNNKDTVRALVEATLELPGGPALMEDLFFSLDRQGDIASLRSVARVLALKTDHRFYDRLKQMMASTHKESKLALIEALPELPAVMERGEVLAIVLRDPSIEVREAAAEALFALGRGDYGYDPEAPEAEREQAIGKMLAWK